MSATQYRVIDHVERETAELLERNEDAILAHDDGTTYVLEEVDDAE
ncbi:hypothetical protein PM038_00190 [Halorubrum ezzemoulense]|nr:hypothetical protein [Halorubrum ezzemoulense]MDB2283694.1 hypothetical protein [Halorubrum ezzemoulense]